MAKKDLNIYKIGGNVVNDQQVLETFLKDLACMKGLKVLVHGGGNSASELSKKLGIEPKMIAGRRVTDTATLDVVVMVYAGLINKKIVSQLQQYDSNAIGLSGADANSIEAHKRIVESIDYGFAGDIDQVNTKIIQQFLELELTPVFCALTHDRQGQLLNTNADTIAATLAIAMSEEFNVTLNFVFEHKGVLEELSDKNSVIPVIDHSKYLELIEKKVIADGMLPKLHNCFHALENGVSEIRIGNEKLAAKGDDLFTKLVLKK